MNPSQSTTRHLFRHLRTLLLISLAAWMTGCISGQHPAHQSADVTWVPVVAKPMFVDADGPVVLVDSAHGNWHTIDGRFRAFADLLRHDGYDVRNSESAVSPDTLKDADVFVIANAVLGGENSEWILPTPGAFTAEEIKVLANWVDEGGSLLLIADHMPFPGATSELADTFGIVFLNGYAKKSLDKSGTLTFSQKSGLLAEHPITRGRNQIEAIPSVKSFTGQAFRIVVPALPIMTLPDNWEVFLPIEAGEFRTDTPKVSARGLLQGATLKHGKGRVAVFGEAAMFTAQEAYLNNGERVRFGMSDPEATHNAQFVLNVMHWLSGLLDR